MTQSELAREAGISQASVSRATIGKPERTGRARARLFNYMQQAQAAAEPALAAVTETWDGSDEHAQALAKLILASGELWPRMGRANHGELGEREKPSVPAERARAE